MARYPLALACGVLLLAVSVDGARADVFRPAYLELRQVDPETWDVAWKVPARGEELRLGIAVRFAPDVVDVSERRGGFTGGAHVERWRIRRPGGLAGQTVEIDGLSGGITDVLARVERSNGTSQVARILPERPRFVIDGATRPGDVARTYLVLGVEHILGGVDHLLFVAALLLIVRGARRVVGTVTAFTVAHSLTLAAATLGLVHVPQPPVEAAIALSIAFVAAEIVHGLQGRPGLTARSPWIVAFVFGLLHGLGFAGALAQVGLPERSIPLALLFFNVGVELGQLAFVGVVATLVTLARRAHVPWPRGSEAVPAYVIGTIAMFWVIQRIGDFGSY